MLMKLSKILLCISLLCSTCLGTIEAKKSRVVQKPMYMIGFAISTVDSMVFISDMHLVKDLTVEKKTKFLMDRQLYSQQFKHHLDETYKGGPYIPAVFFSPKLKKMERKYLSLHKRYVNRKDMRMVLVDQSQFRFKAEEYIEDTILEGAAPKKKGKKAKRAERP